MKSYLFLARGALGRLPKSLIINLSKQLALKIIRNKNKFEYQAKVEIKVLQDIKENDVKDKSNIIQLINNFEFRKHK